MINLKDDLRLRDETLFPCVKRWFTKNPLILTEGKASVLTDHTGKEYIDLFGMYSASGIGYSHPKVVQAIQNQSVKLIHASYDFHTNPALELAEKITKLAPKGITKSYFVNSGCEAVELAIYTARKATANYEIIALYGGFHGRSYGARTLIGWSKYKVGGGPYLPGVLHIPSYYCYRCTLGLKYPECGLQCAKMLRDVLTYQSAGEVAAFIVEPVLGSAGNIPPPPGYFKEIKKILDEYEILLIADEIITGLGRTGKMFGIDHYGVNPDIITGAKALGGGLPIYATLAKEEIANRLHQMDFFTTFGGNPLSCQAAIATINVIIDENLVERSEKSGKYFLKRLKELAETHELIGDVRGVGLMIGVELVKNQQTKEPAVEESIKIRDEARKRGLILPSGLGWLGNVMRIAPPLVITQEQIDKSIEIIEHSLRLVERSP